MRRIATLTGAVAVAAGAMLGLAGTASAEPDPIPAPLCEEAGGFVLPIGNGETGLTCWGGYLHQVPVLDW